MTDWSSWKPKESATLCFIRDGGLILMIRKKRGLGAGRINGVGGRLEPGELPLAGIVREAREELGIELINPVKRGELHFQFLGGYSLFCSVFVALRFYGRPFETEEAVPVWFDPQSLPLDEMWEDDKLWLPRMLDGESFSGFFVFDGEKMVSQLVVWGTDRWGSGRSESGAD